MFELCEDLLDRVETGAVGRQEEEPYAHGPYMRELKLNVWLAPSARVFAFLPLSVCFNVSCVETKPQAKMKICSLVLIMATATLGPLTSLSGGRSAESISGGGEVILAFFGREGIADMSDLLPRASMVRTAFARRRALSFAKTISIGWGTVGRQE